MISFFFSQLGWRDRVRTYTALAAGRPLRMCWLTRVHHTLPAFISLSFSPSLSLSLPLSPSLSLSLLLSLYPSLPLALFYIEGMQQEHLSIFEMNRFRQTTENSSQATSDLPSDRGAKG